MDLSQNAGARVFSRAGLLGNPGDGYGGKALATTIYDFAATVSVEPADGFSIHQAGDALQFPSLLAAAEAFEEGASEDASRLIWVAVKRFCQLAAASPTPLDHGAHLHYDTTIPRQVGLSGSSALIIAAIRALGDFVHIAIDPFKLSEAALAAELEDLGIAAGAMDRVVQSYGGTMLMDLAEPRRPEHYRPFPTALLPPLFLAWTPGGTKNSGHLHGPLRQRWKEGDREVAAVVTELRALVDEGVTALESDDHARFGDLMSKNFELRQRIFPVTQRDKSLIALAGSLGCPAKLAGSGGAIVGMVGSGSDDKLEAALREHGASFIRPTVEPPPD